MVMLAVQGENITPDTTCLGHRRGVKKNFECDSKSPCDSCVIDNVLHELVGPILLWPPSGDLQVRVNFQLSCYHHYSCSDADTMDVVKLKNLLSTRKWTRAICMLCCHQFLDVAFSFNSRDFLPPVDDDNLRAVVGIISIWPPSSKLQVRSKSSAHQFHHRDCPDGTMFPYANFRRVVGFNWTRANCSACTQVPLDARFVFNANPPPNNSMTIVDQTFRQIVGLIGEWPPSAELRVRLCPTLRRFHHEE